MNTMAEALRKAGLVTEEIETKGSVSYDIEKTPMDLFREASVENPVFAKITIFDDTRFDFDNWKPEPPISVWEGLVACEGVKNVTIEESKWETRNAEMAIFRGIEDGTSLHEETYSARRLEPIQARSLEQGNFYVQDIVKTTPELMKQYTDIRDQMVMTLRGHVFPEFKAPKEKMEYKYGNFDAMQKVRKNCLEAMNNPLVVHTYELKGLDDYEDAEKWLLKNHPEEAISFVYSTTTGNFNLQISLDAAAEKSYLGTREEREDYVRDLAARYGIDIPEFNYRDADKALAERAGKEREDKAWTPSRKEQDKAWKPKNKEAKSKDDDRDR